MNSKTIGSPLCVRSLASEELIRIIIHVRQIHICLTLWFRGAIIRTLYHTFAMRGFHARQCSNDIARVRSFCGVPALKKSIVMLFERALEN
jgi:hypothetical protein